MSEIGKRIIVDIEPRNKEFQVEVYGDTRIDELISTLIQRCQDEGVNISEWSERKTGSKNTSLVLMRKSTGNTAIAPDVTFSEIFPELEDRETFKLDARAQAGK